MFEEKQQIISQKFTFDHALFVVMTSDAEPTLISLINVEVRINVEGVQKLPNH